MLNTTAGIQAKPKPCWPKTQSSGLEFGKPTRQYPPYDFKWQFAQVLLISPTLSPPS